MKKYLKFFIFFSILFLCFASLAHATTILNQTVDTDTPSVAGFSQLIIAVANWILGIVGSLALLAFVAGGFMMMASGGSSQMVDRGRQTLIGAVIGLVIVFSSWLIIKYVTTSLGGTFTAGTTSSSQTQSGAESANATISAEKAASILTNISTNCTNKCKTGSGEETCYTTCETNLTACKEKSGSEQLTCVQGALNN